MRGQVFSMLLCPRSLYLSVVIQTGARGQGPGNISTYEKDIILLLSVMTLSYCFAGILSKS